MVPSSPRRAPFTSRLMEGPERVKRSSPQPPPSRKLHLLEAERVKRSSHRPGSSEGGIPPPGGGGPGPASAPVRGKQCSAASACARGVIVLRRLNKSLMGEITHAHLKRNVIKRLGDRG